MTQALASSFILGFSARWGRAVAKRRMTFKMVINFFSVRLPIGCDVQHAAGLQLLRNRV